MISYAQNLILAGLIGIPNGILGIPMGRTRKAKRVPWEYGHGSSERLHLGSMGNVKAYAQSLIVGLAILRITKHRVGSILGSEPAYKHKLVIL